MLARSIDLLTEADLHSLKEERVPEKERLEYKEALPGNDSKTKVRFLADVSSLANAAGGDIVFGVEEEREPGGRSTGFIKEIVGIADFNADHEKRRLDNILLNGVQPRIHGVQMREIKLENGNHVLVVRVPKSWAAPHVVDYENHWRFYARNVGSAGNHQLDVHELKSAFQQSGLTQQQIAQFRVERVARVMAGEGPVALAEGAKVALHMIPLNSFDPAARYDLGTMDKYRLRTLVGSATHSRVNLDGLVAYAAGARSQAVAYTQVFRDGRIEAFSVFRLSEVEGHRMFSGGGFEESLIVSYNGFAEDIRKLGVVPPVAVALTLLGVRGCSIRSASEWVHDDVGIGNIDRDELWLSEELIDDLLVDGAKALRPLIDLVWNSAGWEGSPNYDKSGHWERRRKAW